MLHGQHSDRDRHCVAPPRRRAQRCEWPTLTLTLAVYAAWLLVTALAEALPAWALAALGGPLLCLHGSLQHEAIHGHPFRHRRLNRWLTGVPLSLWLPYAVYRREHLRHHRCGHLTDARQDPESWCWSAAAWARLPRPLRAVLHLNATLLGRLTLGPLLAVAGTVGRGAARLARGDGAEWRLWAGHGLACVPVLAWLQAVCALPLLDYLLLCVWPGLSLTLLRSFAEHRPGADEAQSCAIIESNRLMGLLYLNNNLHLVHHRWPTEPWYRLPRLYRSHRDGLLGAGGGYRLSGYVELWRRHWWRPWQPLIQHAVEPTSPP